MKPLYDIEAERELAGTAVATARGARLVLERVDLDHIFDWRMRKLIEAAAELDEVRSIEIDQVCTISIDQIYVPDTAKIRVAAAATMTGFSIVEVAQLVEIRTFLTDELGRWPVRVRDAARRRQLLERVEDIRLALMGGAPPEEVLPLLEEVAA